jgi:hypothetical protein
MANCRNCFNKTTKLKVYDNTASVKVTANAATLLSLQNNGAMAFTG